MPEERQAPTSQGIIPKPGDPIATPQATGNELNKAKEKGSEALPDDRHEELAQWMATPKKFRRMRQYEFAKLKGVAPKTLCDWENRPDVIARAAFLTRMSKERGQIIVRREWSNIVEKQTDKALGGLDWSAEFCKEVGYPEEQVRAAAAKGIRLRGRRRGDRRSGEAGEGERRRCAKQVVFITWPIQTRGVITDVLDRRISLFLCLPLESLDKLAIQKEIDRIGKEMPELKAHA